MFNPTREQVRQFFCQAWQKHRQRSILEGAEVTAADLILQHPEYHALLEDPATAIEQEFSPESGQMNPFLHLSLHLAVAEQVSIDQPPGSFCLPDAARAGRRSRGCARDPRMPRRDDLACRAPWPGDGRERVSRVRAARRRHLSGTLAAPGCCRASRCCRTVPPTLVGSGCSESGSGQQPAERVHELAPRCWKALLAADPLRSPLHQQAP
jgi:hypothetical protein